MAYDMYCVAIKKTLSNVDSLLYEFDKRCKIKHINNSIFCAIHKKKKKNPIRIALDINPNKQWISIPFTNEEDNTKTIQEYRLRIISEQIDKEKNLIELYITTITCIICFEEVSSNDKLLRCNKSNHNTQHLICSECMYKYITALKTDGIGSNMCMFDKESKCGGEYSIELMNSVLPTLEQQLEWQELLNISEIYKLASICDDYVICPLCCKYGCIFEIYPGANQDRYYIPCAKCNKKWCNICKRKQHGNQSCYKLNFSEDESEDKQIIIINNMIQDITTKALTHCCSTCGCPYIKEEGCNLMICSKCNSMSCFLCNMKLYYKNNVKYWHFIGQELAEPNAVCPLWNNIAGDGKENQGNTEFNELAVKKELLKFISANISSHNIMHKIITQLTIQFEKDKKYENFISDFIALRVY